MAGPDPRARSRSQCPRHTSQIAIHCIPPWGDPSRPSSADVNLARYLILTELAPRLSDSVVLGRGTWNEESTVGCRRVAGPLGRPLPCGTVRGHVGQALRLRRPDHFRPDRVRGPGHRDPAPGAEVAGGLRSIVLPD